MYATSVQNSISQHHWQFIALLETCQCCFCFLTAHVAALDHRIVLVGYQLLIVIIHI
ncbi:hypothetical protein BYT27DRAFT_7179415 [Phlegmacium glaucopus]|nr:hypothetical protein BYT27DRAFT_7179415 [Phlegmacium glaucopus]